MTFFYLLGKIGSAATPAVLDIMPLVSIYLCVCVGGGGINNMTVLWLVMFMYPGRGVCGYGKIWEMNLGQPSL